MQTALAVAMTMPPPSLWQTMNKQEKEVAVRAGVARKRSFGLIAQYLGTTRNAVIGFAHRNAIAPCAKPQYSAEESDAVKAKRREADRRAKEKQAMKNSKPAPAPTHLKVVAATEPQPKPDPVPFLKIRDVGQCHWPLWGEGYVPVEEKLYCGAGVAHTARGDRIQYCMEHAQKAYQPGALERLNLRP